MAKKKKSKKTTKTTEVVPKLKKKAVVSPTPSYVQLSRATKLITLALFILTSGLLYFQSLGFGYVLDDKLVYTENNFVTEGVGGISKLLTTESFTGYFGEEKNLVQGSRYRPLSLISFGIENQLFGDKNMSRPLSENQDKNAASKNANLPYIAPNAKASHLINILLYAICGWLIFLMVNRLIKSNKLTQSKLFMGLAFLTALLFIVHPLHVEAVANVKGRDEILSLLFSVAAFHNALKYVDSKRILWLVSSLLLFFLGLLAKENTLTFLAIIPFGIYLFRKNSGKQNVKVFIGLFVVSALYLLLRYQVVGFLIGDAPSDDIMNNSFAGMDGIEKYATIFYTLLHYLKLNIFPYPLTHDYYPYHIPISSFGDWQVILAIILHILLFGVMVYFWKRKKIVTFAIGYYFATMSIVSNLFISIGTFMNERFAFAASLATCLLLAKFISTLLDRNNKGVAMILAGVFVLGYSFISFTRVPAWESELTLNTAAIKVSKNSARANSFMATALFNKYKVTTTHQEKKALLLEAKPYADKAVEIHPIYYNGNLMKVGIAAELHKMDRKLEPLLKSFNEAATIRPDIGFVKEYLSYINTKEDQNKMLAFYQSLANNLIDKHQRYDWAISYLNLAMEIDPNDPRIRSLMRKAYTGLGRLEDANRYR